MASTNPMRVLGGVLLLGQLSGACAPAIHARASRVQRTDTSRLLAQATCWNTMSCCIQRNPLTAADSCGATAVEIAEVLNGMKVVHEAVQSSESAEAAAEKDPIPA